MRKNLKIYLGVVLLLLTILGASCSKDPALSGTLSSQLVVSTQGASAVSQTSALSGVQVTGGFSEDVLDKGICWSTTSNPTIQQNKLTGGSGSGISNLSLTGLTPGTAYYLRAYATTRSETIYGEQKQFTTVGYQLATITTSPVTNITFTTAAGGGNVTALGGGTVTAKGICWNTTGTPTISNSRTSDGGGLGAYSSSLSGLLSGTTYYVRAYATNQAGTVYGAQISFTTASIQFATLTTPVINSISQNTVSTSTNITADGGATVTTKGVCWSTLSSPTIANARTVDGSGTGSFNSTVTGLIPGTTYYLRAYATNGAGTAYSAQVILTTNPVQLATVSSVTVNTITRNTAQASGSVTADGGGTISTRGICWSTNSNPTLTNSSYSSSGAGTGTLSTTLTGLVSGTTYYVRGYATNAAGTSYGAVTTFRTL